MRLGIPHPRFTYARSGNSSAARCAICSLVNRDLAGMTLSCMPLPGITKSFRLHDAMNEDRRCHDMFRIYRTGRHNFFHFCNGRLRRHGHDGIEISCGQPIGQIPQLIGLLSFDQGIVGMNRKFQNATLALKDALFLSFCNFRAHAHGGVETLQTSASGTHSLAQNPLRHEFQSHFLRREPFLKMVGVRSGKRGNHMLDLIVLEHQPKLTFARPAIVADGGDVLRSFPRQRMDQVIRKARASESSEHNLRAVGNIRHSLVEASIQFLFHRALIAPARAFGRNLAATPLARSQRPVSVPFRSCSKRVRRSPSSSTSISSRALRRNTTRAWACSASARCFAKLPLPKCEGNNVGGVRSMAFVPVPSRDGTITKAGAWHSEVRSSSMSLDWMSGRSSGRRSNPLTPLCSQILEAASTEWLSEICCSSRRISQRFSSANCMTGSQFVTTKTFSAQRTPRSARMVSASMAPDRANLSSGVSTPINLFLALFKSLTGKRSAGMGIAQ